ncbi:MAG TPA: TSUP family transporter, partial [Burkholderiales bacterium]
VTVLVNLPRAAGMVAMGGFVFAFGVYSLLHRRPRLLSRAWAPVAGFVGGATSALFGAGGPSYVIYLSQRGLGKDEFRATLGLCIVTSISLRVAAFLFTGLLLDKSVWIAAALVVPVSFIGVSLAKRIYLRISRETLLRAVFILLLFSGASLIVRGLSM